MHFLIWHLTLNSTFLTFNHQPSLAWNLKRIIYCHHALVIEATASLVPHALMLRREGPPSVSCLQRTFRTCQRKGCHSTIASETWQMGALILDMKMMEVHQMGEIGEGCQRKHLGGPPAYFHITSTPRIFCGALHLFPGFHGAWTAEIMAIRMNLAINF